MTISDHFESRPLLLLIAGAKGAIGSTLAVAAAACRHDPAAIASHLTTEPVFSDLLPLDLLHVTGWDLREAPLVRSIADNGVIPAGIWEPHRAELEKTRILEAPDPDLELKGQVDLLMADIRKLRERHPERLAVLINLLPAAAAARLRGDETLAQLYGEGESGGMPDLAYALAAVLSGVPVINFTPNRIEIPALLDQALQQGVPICGRDGKTGQTYFKLVLASALKARGLYVDGWYSMNILGNEDGANLMDPERARGKLANKTDLLDGILGYPVGERYNRSTHKVHIDYYPPRGDAKEAWDVIDLLGIFDLPMSIRVNLQGRDSILAAPMALDLARWMAVLLMAGRRGPIPELGFFFKKPVGDSPPLNFQDQLAALDRLMEASLGLLA
jgi:myo-inositol-1-phosphate synthase